MKTWMHINGGCVLCWTALLSKYVLCYFEHLTDLDINFLRTGAFGW